MADRMPNGEPINDALAAHQAQLRMLTSILAKPCPTCRAGSRADCSQKKAQSYQYVIAPHEARVDLAGFNIISHPTDRALRYYEAKS